MISLYRNVLKEPCAQAGIDIGVVVDSLAIVMNTGYYKKSYITSYPYHHSQS